MHDDRYASCSQTSSPSRPAPMGTWFRLSVRGYFTAMKLAPDLAANISKMNGLPICVMTSQKYTAPSGLEGQSGAAVLDGLKAEIQKLVNAFTSDEYNLPLSAS